MRPKDSRKSRYFAVEMALLMVVAFAVPLASSAYAQDLDCIDIGHEVSISGSDPNGQDADHDGIGREGWGGGGSNRNTFDSSIHEPSSGGGPPDSGSN